MVNPTYVGLQPPAPFRQDVLFRRLMAELACRSTCHACAQRKHALRGYGDKAYCCKGCWRDTMDACGCGDEWCDTCVAPCAEGGDSCLIKRWGWPGRGRRPRPQ